MSQYRRSPPLLSQYRATRMGIPFCSNGTETAHVFSPDDPRATRSGGTLSWPNRSVNCLPNLVNCLPIQVQKPSSSAHFVPGVPALAFDFAVPGCLPIVLRARYALSGTDIFYGPTRAMRCPVLKWSEVDAYGPTHALRDVRY
eukprot:9848-Rhodomonas_salina.6